METGQAKLDAALAKVTAGVKRLVKDERNAHAGYNFAGIDDFLEMTGKLCGAAGVTVVMDEVDFDVLDEFFATKNGKVAGLKMKFAIYMRCEGEQAGPYHRSIIVPANMGSQAFGAAQSYVEKQFLRATFQIPTGDKGDDIDAHDTGLMDPPKVETVGANELKMLRDLLLQAEAAEDAFCEHVGVDRLENLPVSRFAKAKKALEDRIARMKPPADAVAEDEIPY